MRPLVLLACCLALSSAIGADELLARGRVVHNDVHIVEAQTQVFRDAVECLHNEAFKLGACHGESVAGRGLAGQGNGVLLDR